MNENLEIFFPTKDRNEELSKCLDSIFKFCPDCLVTVANCSTEPNTTSEVLKNHKGKVNEIVLSSRVGIAESFRILIDRLTRKYCLWLSDDLVLIKSLDEAFNEILSNQNLKIIGLPMKDVINFEDPSYKTDEFGCAVWIRHGIRASHFCLTESEMLKELSEYIGPDNQIDLALHDNMVFPNNYKFLKGEPFIFHDRYMDKTRINRIK